MLLLLGVAFITLFERLILALTQFRKGPNKTGGGGFIQPLIDGVKLLLKTFIVPSYSLPSLLVMGARWTLCVMVIVWSCLKPLPLHGEYSLRRWLLILVLGLGVYGIFLSGFRGVSKYGLLGGMRGCIQSVGYEVRLAFVVFSLVILNQHTNFILWRRVLALGGLPLWFIRYVAEISRAPLDFAEGERELVRGFNIEYRRFLLALIFVGEYGIVLCLSWFTRVILLGGRLFFVRLFALFRLIIRSTFPRFRYDKLLTFCWTCVLPSSVMWALISFVRRSV